MIRHCNGQDEWLRSERTPNSEPCTCDLTFDDVTRSTVYPHVFLPTIADRQQFAEWLETVSVDELVSMDPRMLASAPWARVA